MKELPENIVGERITLRPITVRDAEGIVRLANENPQIVKKFAFFSSGRLSPKKEREYLGRMIESSNDAIFAICSGEGEFYGTCGIHDIDWNNDTARLGYILFNPESHGRGIAQEAVALLLGWAFNALGMNKIYLNAFTTNTAGLSTDLAIGFQFEGRLRDFYKIRGKYVDVYHMSILKKEWEERG